jgi:hypothetical protein
MLTNQVTSLQLQLKEEVVSSHDCQDARRDLDALYARKVRTW